MYIGTAHSSKCLDLIADPGEARAALKTPLHTGGLAVGGSKKLLAVKVELGFESELWLNGGF